VVQFAGEQSIPFMLLGNGSNLIIKDGGIRGIVMYLGKINKIEITNDKLTDESGALIVNASKAALEKKLSGLEFNCCITCSVIDAFLFISCAYVCSILVVLMSDWI